MVDQIRNSSGGADAFRRFKEIRRGEYAPEVSIADSSIPGSGLFFSTDNEMSVAGRINVFRAETTGTFDTNLWTTAVVGTGTATHNSSGELALTTGATANSTVRVTTPKIMRQMAGTTQFWIGVFRLSDLGTANNVRRWGIYDDNDGFFFELSGSVFSVVSRKTGVDTKVAYASCNGPATEIFNPATDLTKMNQFNIYFGGLSCRWQVNGRVLHGIGANAISAPLSDRLALPFRVENNNSAGSTSNVSVFSRGISFHRVSPTDVAPRYLFINSVATTVVRAGAGTLRRISYSPNGISGTVTVYDNTAASGPLVTVFTVPATGTPGFIDYGVEVDVGLTVVTNSTVGITVSFD